MMGPEPGFNKTEFEGKSKEELISKINELGERFERLKAEHNKCSRESESYSLLANIVNQSNDAIIGFTLDGVLTAWNRGAERIYGYTAQEAIGKTLPIIIPPEEPYEMPKMIEAIKKGRRLDYYESVRMRKDGTRIDTSLSISPIFDSGGHIIGASCISRDITGHKRLEKELRESEENYRRIVETAEEGIIVVDKNDKVTFANQKIANMLDYKIDEIIGQNIFVLADKESIGCLAYIMAEHQKGIKMQFDFKFRKKDGTHIWAVVPTTPFFNELGEFTGALYMVSDISEHIKTEEELHAAKAEIEIYIDLMSHDIRNLNQISVGYLELAIDALDRGVKPDDQLKQSLYKSLQSLNNSSKLIDNVKMILQKRTGGIKLRAIDIGQMLDEVKKLYEIAPGRVVTINYTPAKDCLVMANELLLDVFSNIIGNAIKHSTGPIVVDIGVEKFTSDYKRYYMVSITDNGPGIPDEQKGKLFTRFEKGKTKAGGGGLGLYLVKTLLEDFHGVIWIENRIPGDYTKGSRFVILLPVM